MHNFEFLLENNCHDEGLQKYLFQLALVVQGKLQGVQRLLTMKFWVPMRLWHPGTSLAQPCPWDKLLSYCAFASLSVARSLADWQSENEVRTFCT